MITGRAAPCSLLLIVLGVVACGSTTAPTPPVEHIQPDRWDQALHLREAVDLDPDPAVVRVALEAKTSTVEIGASTPARGLWTFDGDIPGPIIRANRGDRVIVEATNHLPIATTIHWHGVRVPIEMDGVPGVSQPEIQPGESFTYDFVVPDAGMFWYHPHVESAAAVGFGLYGALVVADPSDPTDRSDEALGGTLPADELVLVLSDLGLEQDGTLAPADTGGALGTLFGREGDLVLVNGRVHPILKARAGRAQRWRIVNAAKSRYFQLELPGHTFTVLGGDGGRATTSTTVEHLVIVPGARAEVLVTPQGTPGDTLRLRWVPYDRGFGSTEYRDVEDIMFIALDPRPAVEPTALPNLTRSISPLSLEGATPIALRLEALETGSKVILGINGLPSWDASPIEVHVGDTVRFDVTNAMDWSHPFHLHGFFFQELGADGTVRSPITWKDTIDIPRMGSRSLVAKFDERPGMWMFHCHILDHAEAGMMGMIDLMPR